MDSILYRSAQKKSGHVTDSIFLFPRTFEVVSMDLISMGANNEEHMEIILVPCFET